MQKEFDLVKILSDTAKVKEMDSIRAIGAKEMLDEKGITPETNIDYEEKKKQAFKYAPAYLSRRV